MTGCEKGPLIGAPAGAVLTNVGSVGPRPALSRGPWPKRAVHSRSGGHPCLDGMGERVTAVRGGRTSGPRATMAWTPIRRSCSAVRRIGAASRARRPPGADLGGDLPGVPMYYADEDPPGRRGEDTGWHVYPEYGLSPTASSTPSRSPLDERRA